MSPRTTRYDLRAWRTTVAPDGSVRGPWSEVAAWNSKAGKGLLEGGIIGVAKR